MNVRFGAWREASHQVGILIAAVGVTHPARSFRVRRRE